MEKCVERFKEVVAPKPTKEEKKSRSNLNTFCGNLHFKVTPCILLIFVLIIFYPHFMSSPINCFLSHSQGASKSPASEQAFLNRYCFTLSTYTVYDNLHPRNRQEIYHGVGPDNADTEEQRHNYYQYVPYFLLLQCIVFLFPYYLWNDGAHQENGLIGKLVAYLDEDVETAVANPEELNKSKKTVHFEPRTESSHIVNADTSITPKSDEQKRTTANEKIQEVAEYFFRRRGNFFLLSVFWIACDVLALLATAMNFYFIDLYLGGTFATYGISALKLNLIDDHQKMVNFPRMTKCRVSYFGPTGSLMKRDALCVMAMNMYFSYMFLFLWYWYLVLAVITVGSSLTKFVELALLKLRPSNYQMSTRGTPTLIKGPELRRAVSLMNFGDIVFFLLMSRNLLPNTYKAFVRALSKKRFSIDNLDFNTRSPQKRTDSKV